MASAVEPTAADSTNQVPATKSLWQRETLTDDWFGYGSSLRDHGVSFNGSLTQFYKGYVEGSGPHDWKYGGKADGFLRIDGAKIGLWQGFGINAHAEINYGESLVAPGGTLLPNNLALLFPGTNGAFADLSLYLTQQIDNNLTLMFGKIIPSIFTMPDVNSAVVAVSSSFNTSSSLRRSAALHRPR
jgi:porin